ncbi:MAG: (4Fe-4S)-binding protein [Eubacteriales bacterium]|nr:(4Fe-4S)-binding protein [Eubacteriales bacterium]
MKIVESSVSPEEIKRLKGLGCLRDKRYPDLFNIRVITRNGKISAEEHRAIAEASERFGSGEVTMTTRLSLEIQGVNYENIDAVLAFLGEHGLTAGGTGAKVRPVVSCKGTTCQYGLLDSHALSRRLHELYYVGYHEVALPHKFKIAVGGCPNNCVKPDLNDIGIIGQRIPTVYEDKCKNCKKCRVSEACPVKVAHIENDKICISENECIHCGRCKGKCPFDAVSDYQDGYKIYIGGRWGKRISIGKPLTRIFHSEEEVIEVVKRAIHLFRDEGIKGERFSDTIARLGFDYVNDKLIKQ